MSSQMKYCKGWLPNTEPAHSNRYTTHCQGWLPNTEPAHCNRDDPRTSPGDNWIIEEPDPIQT